MRQHQNPRRQDITPLQTSYSYQHTLFLGHFIFAMVAGDDGAYLGCPGNNLLVTRAGNRTGTNTRTHRTYIQSTAEEKTLVQALVVFFHEQPGHGIAGVCFVRLE